MDKYDLLHQIGEGSFGNVCVIKRKADEWLFVWKEIDYGQLPTKEKHQLVAEVNILRELKHPNIVRYWDRIVDKENTRIFIVMEYCEAGDLRQMLKKCKRNMDYIAEDVVWKVFGQIVLALQCCHNRESKILHRDIKPGNIFFDRNHNVKLGDFGLSKEMSSNSVYAETYVGTPYYQSPEQVNEDGYNEKSDIWSLGWLVYEMAALHPPFEAENHLALAMKIRSGQFSRLPGKYSDELMRVIAWMLQVDPSKRPCGDDLLNLPLISYRLRDKRLQEEKKQLQKKEQELARIAAEIALRESKINDRRQDLDKRELAVREALKEIN